MSALMASDPDQRAAAEYLLKLKKASLSFMGFMDYYHPEMEWAGFHRELQEALDLLEKDGLVTPGGNPIRNLLITMPPRHAKSFNGTINFPAYALMRKPKREVMICGYNAELAATFGRGTRDIVTDKRAVRAFDKFELSRETRAVDFWKTREGGAYYAVGVNGTTTGRGANFLGVDDPYKTREEAESTTTRRKIWDYYIASLLTRLQPGIDGQPAFQIVTHTRWHPDDMAGRIIESPQFKRGEWLHLNFQALTIKERAVYIRRSHLEAEDPRFIPADPRVVNANGDKISLLGSAKDDGRYAFENEEQALWPERFPVAWLKEQKAVIGEREFASLYQQEPYVLGGNIFKEGWFRRYTPETRPDSFYALVIGVDTAFKAKSTNDYSVFTLAGITHGGDIYVLRVWREKLEFPELKRKTVMLNAQHRGQGLRGFYVEDAASGQSLIQELKRDSGVAIIPWKPGSADKVLRANGVTPLVEGGRVYIPEEADWLDDWLAEVLPFPSVKNDDQVDSLVITLDVLSRMVVTGATAFDAPIGDFIASKEMGSDMFAATPLKSDGRGWLGAGGFGQASKDMLTGWSNWGE